jgi:ATP-dependent Clp protease protease subunit
MRYTVNVDERVRVKDIESACYMPIYIKFSGAFTEQTANKFCEELEAAEDHCVKAKQEVLPIIIDSYGGEVYSLLAMIDMINACKIKVATIVEGKAMSCGAVLLTCGAEGYRFCAPSATVMIHEVSSMNWGKNEEIKANAAETDRLNERIFKMMAKNCGHKEDYFLELVHQKKHADWFLDSDEAMKHNVVNHVGIPSFHAEFKIETEFRLPNGKPIR